MGENLQKNLVFEWPITLIWNNLFPIQYIIPYVNEPTQVDIFRILIKRALKCKSLGSTNRALSLLHAEIQ